MTKIFKVGNLKYTPFGEFNISDIPYLNSNGIHITEDIKEADILVSQQRKHLKKYFWKYRNKKKYLLWTNEPRFDFSGSLYRKEVFGLVKLQILNVYNEQVFINPYPSFNTYFANEIDYLPSNFLLDTKKTIALMSYYKGMKTESIIINEKDVDLIKKRTEIAIYGNDNGYLDIYGKGWPDNRSKEDSREGDWGIRKRTLMKDYKFNLCFENTVANNYISEKIWDSIANYCLPIYHSGNRIYELFPNDSFIDYKIYSTPTKLFNFIQNISNEEFIRRMNLCIEIYNKYRAKDLGFYKKQREATMNKIVERIKMM